jgi:hypothetical protein
MIFCLMVGDSLAQFTQQAVRAAHGPACILVARQGAGSGEIATWRLPPAPASFVVISAGTNDARNPALPRNLAAIRARITGTRVAWLLPYDRQAAMIVHLVAVRFKDSEMDLAAYPTRDGIHPRSYAGVAGALARWGIRFGELSK